MGYMTPTQRAGQYGVEATPGDEDTPNWLLDPDDDGQKMLADRTGYPVPQVWNPGAGVFVPLSSDGRRVDVQLVKRQQRTIQRVSVPVPVAPGDLTAPVGARVVSLEVQGGGVRFKTTGTAATPTEGLIATERSTIHMSVSEAAAFTAAAYSAAPNLWAVWSYG